MEKVGKLVGLLVSWYVGLLSTGLPSLVSIYIMSYSGPHPHHNSCHLSNVQFLTLANVLRASE